MTYEPIY